MQVYVPNVGLDPGVSPPGTYRLVIFDSDGNPLFVPDTALVAWSEPTLINTSGTGWTMNGYWRKMGDLYEFSFRFYGTADNAAFSAEVFDFSVEDGASPCQDFSLRMPTASGTYGVTPDIRLKVFSDGSCVVSGDVNVENYQVHGFFTNGNIVS